MGTRLRRAAVAIALGVVGAFVFAAPANADELGVFQDANYGGEDLLFTSSVPWYGYYAYSGGQNLNDTVSSLINASSCHITFYTDVNYSGVSYPVNPWTDVPWVGSYFNDKFSSHRWCY